MKHNYILCSLFENKDVIFFGGGGYWQPLLPCYKNNFQIHTDTELTVKHILCHFCFSHFLQSSATIYKNDITVMLA